MLGNIVIFCLLASYFQCSACSVEVVLLVKYILKMVIETETHVVVRL